MNRRPQAQAEQPQEPFIGGDQRPDLTIDANQRVGDLTVRDLAGILGSATIQKQKELLADKAIIKETLKEHKDNKDHKDPKEHKDQKDTKEHKDNKDHKEQKDTKDHKDPKEQKDIKDNKDHKDPKEHKDQKDHKEHKEIIKEFAKELILDKVQQIENVPKDLKEQVEVPGNIPPEGDPAALTSTLQDMIQRISGLEQQVQQLQGGGG